MMASENPLVEPFLAAARAAANERPDVDADLAEELMGEAATMLHNGLALDGLDDHDTHLVTHGLGIALTARDSGAAVRAAAQAVLDSPGELNDPDAAYVAYLNAVNILQL